MLAQHQSAVRQPRRDRERPIGGTDPLDHLPARLRRRKDPVGTAGHTEIRCAQCRESGKIVETIHTEPSAAHVPLHPFRDDLGCLVFVAEAQRARRKPTEQSRHGDRGRGEGPPYGPDPARPRSSERHDAANRRRGRNSREPAQARGAAGGMPQPGERRAVRLLAHARDESGGVMEDPVLKRPGAAPWFARALAVMAHVGEPHVEPGGTKKMRHPAGGRSVTGVQPEAVVREGTVHEEDGGAAIAMGTQPMQSELDAVGRGESPGGGTAGHSYRPAARYASSSSSTGWRARAAMPAAASPAPICMRHPGLPVATTCGAASRRRSSFVLRTARDISGSSKVNSPALPQHSAAPGTGTSSSSGMAANSLSGWTAMPCACSKWHGGSYATCRSSGAPATGPFMPLPASSSVTSRTRAPNLSPRSSLSSRPYSFIRAPQPALFTTIGSSPSPNASTLTRANARASSTSPACSCSAPQQTWPLTSRT